MVLFYHLGEFHSDHGDFPYHGSNSIVMLIDLLIIRHELRFLHFLHPFIIGVIYLLFSYIYYVAGGLNHKGNPFIYAFLDWTNANSAVFHAMTMLAFVILCHLFAWLMQKIRTALHQQFSH